MASFDVDPDIKRARSILSDFYVEPKYFELSRERIFSRTWQFAGHLTDLEQLTPYVMLEGFLDEALLLVKDGDRVTAFSNVCTHRGKILVEKPCSGDLIRCGYHGRRFDLHGRLLSMPEFEGVENFPTDSDNLHRVHVENLGGFVFVSLEPNTDFQVILSECSIHFDRFLGGPLSLRTVNEYDVNAHWALYCENYLEGFHIPYVHRSLNEVIDYGSYATETFRYSSVQTGYDADGEEAGRYLFIFPNSMFNFYPWGISVNIVRPLAPDRTRITFLTYVADETKLGDGAGADLHRVELEDEAVVESVQKGIRSRFYGRGRYSPTREQGTHHFHRLLAEFMG